MLIGRILTINNLDEGFKGFTSHEELSDLGLVHMNARLYDPELKRFVSPDSMIPDAADPLAYNRYAYVNNNPALANDPTGHWAVLAAGLYFIAAHTYSDDPAHHIASTVLFSAATGGYAKAKGLSAAAMASGTALATSAAISGRIGTAEIRAAAFSYVSAKAAHYIGHGNGGKAIFEKSYYVAAAHGVAQGTIGWLRNRNFWGNFVSGSVSHMVGHQIGNVGGDSVGAIVARTGIVSASAALVANATGGNAAHAAMTAAIVHLYNAEWEVNEQQFTSRVTKDGYTIYTGNNGGEIILQPGVTLIFDGDNNLLYDLLAISIELDGEAVWVNSSYRDRKKDSQHFYSAADIQVEAFNHNSEWLRDIIHSTGYFNRVASYQELNIVHVDYKANGNQGRFHKYSKGMHRFTKIKSDWIHESKW